MGDVVKQMLAKPIQLADQVIKAADEASSFKSECSDLKSKTEKLVTLLRQAARASNDLYERPTRRIIDDTEQVLEKALSLVVKCRANGLVKRVFTIIPAAAFRKMFALLENSIGDVSWLLRVSAPADDRDDGYLGLPPIAANEPILCLIWEQIAILHTGSPDNRSDSAASLVSLARDNDRYGKLIIEEGGVVPLLRLVKEGKPEGQENAARAIGLLGRDSESVEYMIHAGACSVFAKVLKEGPMKVQSEVAWTISELAAHDPTCQDLFAQHNIIRLLVGHLAFETVQEHSKYAITGKSLHAVVVASNNHAVAGAGAIPNLIDDDIKSMTNTKKPSAPTTQMHQVITNTMAKKTQSNQNLQKYQTQHSLGPMATIKAGGREQEDEATKTHMKSMAARALWQLARGNSGICKSITESRALLCFAVLLEKGRKEVQYNSAMALMAITSVAEKDPDLRRSAFKPSSPACKAVVDQLLRIVNQEDYDLLIPCINSIGNLARTFRATETRMIDPLVKLLDEKEVDISTEAAVALTKFASSENFLHVDHSKAIINSGGTKHLIQLAYFGGQTLQTAAIILLANIAKHVPDSEELAELKVLNVLEWASKQAQVMQDEAVEELLNETRSKLELYQSRGSLGFH